MDNRLGYNTKQSECNAGDLGNADYSFWSGVVAYDRILSMGQIEVFDI